MGNKKECSCGYWSQVQQECLYNRYGCIRDEEKLRVTEGFIKKWAKALKAEVLVEMEWKNTLPINIFIAGIEETLKDAGVEILVSKK